MGEHSNELDITPRMKLAKILYDYRDGKTDYIRTSEAVEALIAHAVLEARIEEADLIQDRLYDLKEVDWGIPTKWSKHKDHADLWIPVQAAKEMIDSRLAALAAQKEKQ